MTFTVMEPYNGEHLSKILVYQKEHRTEKGKLGLIEVSISQEGFVDQSCIETPPFMTTWRDISVLHPSEGDCYLQYVQQYSHS